MSLTVAYLAQGRVRLKTGRETPRTLESAYANSILEKAVRAQQRHSWKSQGDGFLSGQILWGKKGIGAGPTPVFVTSISRGTDGANLIYSLESGPLCALLSADGAGGGERRLWNNSNFRLQHVRACSDSGHLAFSIVHSNGTANLGVMLKDETGVKELTEGDSVDTAPQWIPGEGRKIVFQSAGVGRNRQGHFQALGPFSIQKLDLDTAEMATLLESSDTDFLAPRITADGALHYIRRPYESGNHINPWRVLKDFVMFPFRLLFAFFQFLNFFSMRYSGKKLTTVGDARARHMDMQQMMIWGNLIRAQQNAEEGEAADMVPGSWQLARRIGGKEEILARGVLAYDLGPDGSIVYSNGNAIFHVAPDGRKERLVSEGMIEQVVVLEASHNHTAIGALMAGWGS